MAMLLSPMHKPGPRQNNWNDLNVWNYWNGYDPERIVFAAAMIDSMIFL